MSTTIRVYAERSGYLSQTGSKATYGTLRSGAGSAVSIGEASIEVKLLADSGKASYADLLRGVLIFDTSSIGSGSTITAVTLSTYISSAGYNALGSAGNPKYNITTFSPADPNSIVTDDYDSFSDTKLTTDKDVHGIGPGRTTWTFNSDGIAAISKSGGANSGHTCLMMRDTWDIGNSFDGTWVKSDYTRITAYGCTTPYPETWSAWLDITYTAVEPHYALQPNLAYKVKRTPAAKTLNLAYIAKRVTTLQYGLEYVVGHVVQHSLTYKIQHSIQSIKGLQYYIRTQHSLGTKDLAYSVVRGISKLLEYGIYQEYDTWVHDTITIMNPVAINNFQHKLDLTWHPTINTDFSDLRFMQLDLTDCPYYIDAHTLVPGVSCTVWIKVPTANQTELRMYHCGLASVTSQSNGDDTFEAFDDFLGSTVRTDKWTVSSYNTTISVASDIITIAAGDNGARGILTSKMLLSAATPVTTEYSACLYNAESTTWSQVIIGCPATPNAHLYDVDHDWCPIDAGCGFMRTIWGGVTYPSTIVYNGTYANIGDTLVGTYHTYKVNSYGTNNTTAAMYRDGAGVATVTQVFAPHVAFGAGNGSYGAYASYLRVDWVRVRKYASTEPTLTVTKRQLGECLKYVVRNHAPVKTLSLYYLCAHNLVTTQYNLKYGIYHTCASPTRSLSYAIPHIEIVAEPSSGSTIPLNVTCHTTIESNVFSKWTWTWDFDGDLGSSMVGATGSINHQFINYGEYDITCTASTTNASATATTHVSIVESTIPFPEFYFYIHPGTYKVDFFNYSSGAVSYDWNFGDGTAHSIETNPTHTYASDDVYTVTLIATNGVGPNTKIKEVQFTFDPPVADFELEYTPPLRFLPQVAVTLTVTDTLGRSDDITKYLYVAPGPFTRFKDLSTGKIKYWEWNFGDE